MIQDLTPFPRARRFPRGHDCVSYCRLVKCAKESGGKRLGTAGTKSGTVHWRWAFAEAAVLCLRQNQPGKDYFPKLARKHGKGKALTVLAHKLARAGYYRRTRAQAVDLNRFVSASPLRGEPEPAVSRATNGQSLRAAPSCSTSTARTVPEHLGYPARSPRRCLDCLSRSPAW